MKLDNIDITNELLKYKNGKIVILGHDFADADAIISGYMIEHILKTDGFDASYCILDEDVSVESKKLLSIYNFDPSKYLKHKNDVKADYYILVDHHERNLDKEIILIVDHHPSMKEINCKLSFNKDISSTALYILMNNPEYFTKIDRERVFLATMLDTASFHSTKGRKIDKNYVLKECSKWNIDYKKLEREGIYLTILDDINQISLNGLKRYNYNGFKVESSYIQIDDNEKENNKVVKNIIEILKEYRRNNNLEMFVFIVHEMINFKSRVYKIKEDTIEVVDYPTYTSRGSTIMPNIEKDFQ